MKVDPLQHNGCRSQSPAEFYRVSMYIKRQSYFDGLNLELLTGAVPDANDAKEWCGIFVKLDPEKQE